MSTATHDFFAPCPKGIEGLLKDELTALGGLSVRETRAGVSFSGSLEIAYRACLWSRLASRVLLPLARFPAPTAEALYDGVRSVRWADHLDANGTLAIDCAGSTAGITHSRFGALKAKDAVCDQLREASGSRPSVDTEQPDLRLHLRLHRDEAVLSIDLSGDALHRRGYRERGVAAPLKENLAAAILVRAGWPEIAAAGGALVDPMCGSGTLPIEAALIAGDRAPGLLREYWGFLGWRGHDAAAWSRLVDEARARAAAELARIPAIRGADVDPRAVRAASANVQRAGLESCVRFDVGQLGALAPPEGALPGLVVVNPPYGERIGDADALADLYAMLGARLREAFVGWQAAVFTGNPELGKQMGLRAHKTHTLYNGAIECRLLRFHVDPARFVEPGERAPRAPEFPEEPSAGAEMFANRLRKNRRHLSKWAAREDVSCYRVYDADLPEYALAVDLYGDQVHVQEYEAPKTVDPAKAEARLREALAVIPRALEVPPAHVHLKVRRRQRGREQYGRHDEQRHFIEVSEGGLRFLVNLTDYLDTGLFLDHRITRDRVRRLAKGRDMLNLFAYTGSATVYAAAGGARSTTSVDLSNTYLDWARRNMALNGFTGRAHAYVQADCLEWLREEEGRYGLVFLDPPTFSNSKRMEGTLDVQRDHVELIRAAARLLTDDGVLLFSNNRRGFRIDAALGEEFDLREVTRATIPEDFRNHLQIHQCWEIRCR